MFKSYNLLIFLGSFILFDASYAQVGVKSASDNSATIFPHPSAALDIQSSNKGVLLPRVPLTSKSVSTPVVSPGNGMLLYNNGSAGLSQKGIYTWDTDPLSGVTQYNYTIPFVETPKTTRVTFNNNINALSGANPGFRTSFLRNDYPEWNTIITLDQDNFLGARLGTGWVSSTQQYNGVILPPGTYTIEIVYNIIAQSSNKTTRSNDLSNTNSTTGYYIMGYFNDLGSVNYTNGSTSTSFLTPITTNRTETLVTTKLDQPHLANFYYFKTFTSETIIFFGLGRASGSSHNDQVIIQNNTSYVRINKIS